jgi:hypothetical protein
VRNPASETDSLFQDRDGGLANEGEVIRAFLMEEDMKYQEKRYQTTADINKSTMILTSFENFE